MPQPISAARDVLALIFQNQPSGFWGSLGSGITGSGDAESLHVSLHSTSPGEGGTQDTGELAYAGYSRTAVPRQAAEWEVDGNAVSNRNDIVCSARTDQGAAVTARFWAIGPEPAGPSGILWSGPLSLTTPVAFVVDNAGLSSESIIAPNHGYVDDDQVVFDEVLGDTLPTGISENTYYFVVNASTDTFQISDTEGGLARDLSAVGSGRVSSALPFDINRRDYLTIPVGGFLIIEDAQQTSLGGALGALGVLVAHSETGAFSSRTRRGRIFSIGESTEISRLNVRRAAVGRTSTETESEGDPDTLPGQVVLNFSQDDGTRSTSPPATLMAPAMVVVDGWDSTVAEGELFEGRLKYRFNDQGAHLTAADPDQNNRTEAGGSGPRVAEFGAVRDISQEQQGFVAANLYLLPQTNTLVELDVEDRNGLSTGSVSTASQVITIAADTRTQRYVSNAGNDSWDGTAGTFQGGLVGPWLTPEHALNECQNAGGNMHIHLNRGDSWTSVTTMSLSPTVSNVVLGTYGTGARPILTWEALDEGQNIFDIDGDVIGIMSLDVRINSPLLLYGRASSNFNTFSGVDSGTDVITFSSSHGFATGADANYSDNNQTPNIGLTDGAGYFVNVISSTQVSLHTTRANAFSDTARVNLTAAGSPGETHNLSQVDNSSTPFYFRTSNRGWMYDCVWEGEPGSAVDGTQAFGGMISLHDANGFASINCGPRLENYPVSGRPMGVCQQVTTGGSHQINTVHIGLRVRWGGYEHQIRNTADAVQPPLMQGYALTWCELRNDFDWVFGAGTKTIRLQYQQYASVFQCGVSSVEIGFDGAAARDTLIDSCFMDAQDISNANAGGATNASHTGLEFSVVSYRVTVRNCIGYQEPVGASHGGRIMWRSSTDRNAGWSREGLGVFDGRLLMNSWVRGQSSGYPGRFIDMNNGGNQGFAPWTGMQCFGELFAIPSDFSGSLKDTNDYDDWEEFQYNLFPAGRYSPFFSNSGGPTGGDRTLSQVETDINSAGGVAGNNTEETLEPATLVATGFLPDVGTTARTAAIPRVGVFHDYRGVDRDWNAATWSAGAVGLEPAIEELGWTDLTPSVDSRLIFVSTSGSDSNDGLSELTPKLTVTGGSGGRSLLRNGFPDHLLLRRGDVFNEQWGDPFGSNSGRSISEPMVFGAYGDESIARPQNTHTGGAVILTSGSNRNYRAIVSIDISPGSYTGTSQTLGMHIRHSGTYFLIEDCYYTNAEIGLAIQISSPNTLFDLRIRRNTVRNTFRIGGNSQGFWLGYSGGNPFDNRVDGLLLEENVLDHCGWLDASAPPTNLNHNVYCTHNHLNVTMRHNISTRASSFGMQIRCGGEFSRNLIVQCPNAMQLGEVGGSDEPLATGVPCDIRENVILEGINGDRSESGPPIGGTGPKGRAINLSNTIVGQQHYCLDNIIANCLATWQTPTGLWIDGEAGDEPPGTDPQAGVNDLLVENNLVYNWYRAFAQNDRTDRFGLNNIVRDNEFYVHTLTTGGGNEALAAGSCDTGIGGNPGITFSGNTYQSPAGVSQAFAIPAQGTPVNQAAWIAQTVETGGTVLTNAPAFTDPTRSMRSYRDMVESTTGSTMDDWADAVAANRKGAWNNAYTYLPMINYIRAGFDRAPLVNGWTPLEPSADSIVIYVANAPLGDDTNTGLTQLDPVRTLAHATTLWRPNMPDQMLLRRGHEWTENPQSSIRGQRGRSPSEKKVFGAWGPEHEPRPIIRRAGQSGVALSQQNHATNWMQFFALVSIDFTGLPRTGEEGTVGLGGAGGALDVLIEDVRVTGFRTNVQFISDATNDIRNLTMRRCQILDAYSASTPSSHSQGCFVERGNSGSGVDLYNVVIEECLFDHNGWLESAGRDAPNTQGGATIFNHTLYQTAAVDGGRNGLVFRQNVSSRASATGIQMRGGGKLDQNFFVETPLQYNWGYSESGVSNPLGTIGTCDGNVCIDATDTNSSAQRGGGANIGNILSGTHNDNVFARAVGLGVGGAIGIQYGYADNDGPHREIGVNNCTFLRNLAHQKSTGISMSYNGDGDSSNATCSGNTVEDNHLSISPRVGGGDGSNVIANLAGGSIPPAFSFAGNTYYCTNTTDRWFDNAGFVSQAQWLIDSGETGSTFLPSPPTYSDPDRNLGSYYDLTEGGIGGSNVDGLNILREMRKGAWRSDYETLTLINYIREGFDLAPLT